MRSVRFVLIREGTSDEGLIPHLSTLLVRSGITSALGTPRDYPGPVRDRLAAVLQEEPTPDVIFVQRDADLADPTKRRLEIETAVESLDCSIPCVPVVPIQELEAWLLVDQAAIRAVAGRPSGRQDLGLPKVHAIESASKPKEILQAALLTAAEATGRRRHTITKAFSQHRKTLLERLDIDGPVRQLESWQMLERDIRDVAATISANE